MLALKRVLQLKTTSFTRERACDFQVYLACNTQTKAKTAHWQKGESGQLPQGAQVVQGVLQLPHVTREDEGM